MLNSKETELSSYRKSRSISLLAIGIGACLTGSLALAENQPSAATKYCYVSKFKFENEGAYQLNQFKVADHAYPGRLSQGTSRTWHLDNANVSAGDEVFLPYQIHQGDNISRKSCEKDGTKLLYHPNGNTWGYWSKGTTRNNNRCRFRINKCITSVE